jgi:hypothetical protein
MSTYNFIAMYAVHFVRKGQRHYSRTVECASYAQAKRVAAEMLSYRDIRSAYSYTSQTKDGDDAEFFCRRKDSHDEDFDCAIIVRADQ